MKPSSVGCTAIARVYLSSDVPCCSSRTSTHSLSFVRSLTTIPRCTQVSCYLSAFLATDVNDRGDMASFEKVMGDMIEMVEAQEETDDEEEGDGSESEGQKA